MNTALSSLAGQNLSNADLIMGSYVLPLVAGTIVISSFYFGWKSSGLTGALGWGTLTTGGGVTALSLASGGVEGIGSLLVGLHILGVGGLTWLVAHLIT